MMKVFIVPYKRRLNLYVYNFQSIGIESEWHLTLEFKLVTVVYAFMIVYK